MNFVRNSQYEGKHAILSPSQCGWMRHCTEEELISRIKSYYAAQIGTAIHELASELIDKRMKINKQDRKLVLLRLLEKNIPRKVIEMDIWYDAFMTFVNDAISYDMSSEIQLIFSDYAFGTTDAIYYDGKVLRIHDLKTGSVAGKMDQLMSYAANFCLQFNIKPENLKKCELRIYQANDILTMEPTADELREAIEITIFSNKVVTKFLEE